MCFDNVFSDDAPIRALAEKAACAKKVPQAVPPGKQGNSCDEQHGMTREQRAPWGQSFEYTWREATLSVSCHRAYYVFGERRCAVEGGS